MARYRREREDAAKLAMEHMETLRALFKKHGIKQITVSYDGYGDEGQIVNVESVPPENWEKLKGTQFVHNGQPLTHEEFNYDTRPATRATVQTTVEDKLKDAVYNLLSKDHGGWEIGSGSYGEFTITPTEVHLTHNDRIEDVETTETDFD